MDKPFVYDPVLDNMINSETDPALFDVVYFNSLPVPNYSNFNVDTNISAEFTPLLSPVIQNNLYNVTQSAKFSPLSSPVLEYNNKKSDTNHQRHSISGQKRKDSSDTSDNNENSTNEKEKDNDDIGGGGDEDEEDDDDNRSFKRSKTPVTTPLLQASDKSLRNSIVSGSRSNSIKDSLNAPLQSFIFKQQTSQTSQPSQPSQPSLKVDLLDELDGGLTLPPPPPPPSQSEIPIFTTSSFNNFRIPRISTKKDSVLINPNHHKSAQSSPVILPSSSSTLDSSNLEFQMINQPILSDNTTLKQQQHPKGSKKLNIKRIGTNILSHQPKQPIMLSGSSTNILSSSPSSSTHDKKTSHKLAEQGRRNRMNIAIQELDQLIPDSMKREITVPSKATTVELACRYIEELLKKLNENEHTK